MGPSARTSTPHRTTRTAWETKKMNAYPSSKVTLTVSSLAPKSEKSSPRKAIHNMTPPNTLDSTHFNKKLRK